MPTVAAFGVLTLSLARLTKLTVSPACQVEYTAPGGSAWQPWPNQTAGVEDWALKAMDVRVTAGAESVSVVTTPMTTPVPLDWSSQLGTNNPAECVRTAQEAIAGGVMDSVGDPAASASAAASSATAAATSKSGADSAATASGASANTATGAAGAAQSSATASASSAAASSAGATAAQGSADAAATSAATVAGHFNATGGLIIPEGANKKQGIVTLVLGTKVVANTSVTANSRIFLTVQKLAGILTIPAVGVSTRVPGVSFTILSASALDGSDVAYQINEQ